MPPKKRRSPPSPASGSPNPGRQDQAKGARDDSGMPDRAPASDPATAGNDDPVAQTLFGDQQTPRVGRLQASYPYTFVRTEAKRQVVEQGHCAMEDSLEQAHGNALRSMYRALRRELGLTVTPPRGTKKDALVAAIRELRERLQMHLEVEARAAQQPTPPPPPQSEEVEGEAEEEEQVSPAERKRRKKAKRRKEARQWAVDLLRRDDLLRQPCTLPLLGKVPYEMRVEISARFVHCLQDLQYAATEQRLRPSDDNYTQELGAWVIVTRVFEASLLRDEGGGGDRYWAKQQHKWRKWDQGFIRECWNWKVRTRSAKRSKRSGVSLKKLHRRAVDLGVESKIGAMCGVYDSAPLAPATEETLVELKKLFPPPFVPGRLACC